MVLLMTRRVVTHHGISRDNEPLTVITIYEPKVNKEQIKKLSPYCKTHQVLIKTGKSYDFK
ncbi:Uncharacterised protein [Niallia circulans]|nr:Uncharacterised protein [Niallia circulans]